MKLSQWIFLGICALALGSTSAWAEADLTLPRERITLVAPPFVHAHEQVAKSGPKIIEFKMTVVEKPIVIDEVGTTIPSLTYNGRPRPPTCTDHASRRRRERPGDLGSFELSSNILRRMPVGLTALGRCQR